MPENVDKSRVTVGRFTKNAIFAVGSQWIVRLIGLISVTITARILTPDDFGLVSISMSVVLLAEWLTTMGVNVALVRHPNPQRDDYNTAWTINLLANVIIAAITAFIVAPVAAEFFQRSEMDMMIRVLSLRFVFVGLKNIGIADFERNLTLKNDFVMRCSARLLTFFITISAAFYLRSYWALVIGAVSLGAAQAFFSYVMNDYRPRLCLKLWRHYLGFSSWMVVNTVAQGLIMQIERLTIGRLAGAHITGFYATSQEVSRMFTWEIMTGLNRVALPSFSKVQHDNETFSANVPTAFGAYAMFAIPLGLGLSATADSLVPVLLGSKWLDAIPYLAIIGIGAGFRAVTAPLTSMLIARNRVATNTVLNSSFAVILAAVVIGVGITYDPLTVARTVVVMHVLFLIAATSVAASVFHVRITAIYKAIGRPCFAGAVMYAAVVSLPLPPDWSSFLDLVVSVASGAIVYGTVLLAVWYLSGRPEGAEAKIVREVSTRYL